MAIDNLIYTLGFDGGVISEKNRKKCQYESYETDHVQLSYEAGCFFCKVADCRCTVMCVRSILTV